MSILLNKTLLMSMAATPIASLQLSIADIHCPVLLPMLPLPTSTITLSLFLQCLNPIPNIHIYPSSYLILTISLLFLLLLLLLLLPLLLLLLLPLLLLLLLLLPLLLLLLLPLLLLLLLLLLPLLFLLLLHLLMQSNSLAPLVQEMCVDGTHPHPTSHRYDITPQHERPGNI